MKDSKNSVFSAIGGFLTFALFAASIAFMWFGYFKKNFIVTVENLGKEMSISPAFVIISFVFIVLLYFMSISGIKLKNKIFGVIPVMYELLLIIAFVLLALLMAGKIEEGTLFTVVEYFVLAVFAPVFGAVWTIGLYALILLIILIIVSTVSVILIYKKPKTK